MTIIPRDVLVTGGTGFVGANLVRRLLADGHNVHLFTRTGRDQWRLSDIRSEVQNHSVDLWDAATVGTLVERIRPAWVFHLATYGAYPEQDDFTEAVRTNVEGTLNLVRACISTGVETFVNTGSSSEYGFKSSAPSEDDGVDPISYYAATKASATIICRQLARMHEVRIVTLRLYSVYGPFEEPGRFVPALVMAGLSGSLPPLASPKIARDFVYVDDVVEAFLLAAASPALKPGDIYNVGTGVQVTLARAVAVARKVFGLADKPVWGSMANRSWDTSVWIADSTRIQEHLGWEPAHDFTSGLKLTRDWFQAHSDLSSRYDSRLLSVGQRAEDPS
jgi:nucleoside-diphosphate-sugar epimerase